MSGSKISPIRGGRWLLLVGLLAVLLVPSAQATPGALDPSFGSGGKVMTAIGSGNDSAWAAAIQPDGRIVAVGDTFDGTSFSTALARYNPDGSLDPTFGTGGKVTTAISPDDDGGISVALQPDGKIVVGGYANVGANAEFALVRYNADGSLDQTFGSGGKVTTAIGSADYVEDVALQPDGKLVAAGASSNGSNYDFALARYNADGSLDASFNGSGTVTTAFGTGLDIAYGVVIQPNGQIVAGGYGWTGSKFDFALARFNADGTPDSGFGSGGKVTTALGSGSDVANAIALQPDGKIVAAGYSTKPGGSDSALVRYNADGTLDSGFGTGGKVTTAIGSHDNLRSVVLQPDGRIVAAGYTWESPTIASEDFTLIRLGADGTLDSSFGLGGKVRTSVGPAEDSADAVALQADGKIVAVGSASNGTDDDFALARIVGSSMLTVTKTGSGSGSVSSSPNGIDCGATCSASFAAGPVTLTATPSAGSSFAGWSGDCSGTGSCTLSMSADQSATARFESDKTLAVTKAGSGTGTVTSSPAGISCGSSCASPFSFGTAVTLTATAAAGSSFAGWSGDCSGTGTCTLTMGADHSATATFEPLCVVPKVKGKTLKAAKNAIKRAHCSVGRVTKAYSSKVKRGRVISQNPKPGKKLAAGSKVKLNLSKGKRP